MAKSTQNPVPSNLTSEQLSMAANAIKSAKDVVCNCGGTIFSEGVKLKKVSRLLTGEDSDKFLPLPSLYCVKCFKELSLEEEKSGSSILT